MSPAAADESRTKEVRTAATAALVVWISVVRPAGVNQTTANMYMVTCQSVSMLGERFTGIRQSLRKVCDLAQSFGHLGVLCGLVSLHLAQWHTRVLILLAAASIWLDSPCVVVSNSLSVCHSTPKLQNQHTLWFLQGRPQCWRIQIPQKLQAPRH